MRTPKRCLKYDFTRNFHYQINNNNNNNNNNNKEREKKEREKGRKRERKRQRKRERQKERERERKKERKKVYKPYNTILGFLIKQKKEKVAIQEKNVNVQKKCTKCL